MPPDAMVIIALKGNISMKVIVKIINGRQMLCVCFCITKSLITKFFQTLV